MAPPRVLVLGGGLSGMAAAYTLARAGWKDIAIVEAGSEPGGLAGTFHHGEHFYPLAYHHVLDRDRTLLGFLDLIEALPRVRWRKIRMLFHLGGRAYDLARPADFLRFPMSLPDKARFARLMLRAFRKSDWSDWQERSAQELVDGWAGPGVRRRLFEPLSRLKFELPCEAVSAAWLGARLHFREGSAPLGYIPGCNWTKVLCDGIRELLEREGVTLRLGERVTRLEGGGGRLAAAELAGGERLSADLFVSTLPTEVYLELCPGDSTPHLRPIRYTAVISAIFATRQTIEPDFYWMNLASLDYNACGLFMLNSLNPTIGGRGESCLNFVTHLASRHAETFGHGDERILAGYREDFERLFGFELRPFWTHLTRLPLYSPVFSKGYHNPPVRSASWGNLYLAGNYRTFPSIASTGTALGSGVEAGAAILGDHGEASDLPARLRSFRLLSMPRG